jgi:hypothetical protein
METLSNDVKVSFGPTFTALQSNSEAIEKITEGVRQERKRYYQKKQNPNKRGPKTRLTDEEKEERHKELLDYHKQYYKVHKEELKRKSYTNYKNNLEKLREIKMKENPDFKPRNRKRDIIDFYISLSPSSPYGTDEGTPVSSDTGENTSDENDN